LKVGWVGLDGLGWVGLGRGGEGRGGVREGRGERGMGRYGARVRVGTRCGGGGGVVVVGVLVGVVGGCWCLLMLGC
jgi:hypothetical protein